MALAGAACVLLVLPCPASASISRSRLRHGLANQMQRVGGASGAWVSDIDAPGDRTLFSSSGHTARVLASNSKLFTTAAVLGRFGPDRRLETRLYPRRAGTIRHGVVHGSLVIVGDGDPALASARFAAGHGLPQTPLGSLAGQVRKAGIKKVTGKVRADDSVFDRRRGVPTTGVDATGELGPLSGLSYDSGFANGHYAKSPELVAARALRGKLRHLGVRVMGGVGRADLTAAALEGHPLAAVDSPEIRSLIAATNTPSNNFFAEMLLKRLAARSGAHGTTRRGARKVERFAHRLGTGVRMEDGSGLSRRNRASPRQVGRLLIAMDRGRDAGPYRDSLAIAGEEGTIAGRMRGTAAQGRCRAKTGTLIGVSALSGLCRAGHGLVAFSFLFNAVDTTLAEKAEDRMAALIARYRP